MRHDPEVLKADVSLAKDRISQLKRELVQITSDISYTQRGVDTLYSVEQKLSARENGCYNISEVQAIREEILKVQKSLISGGKVKDELMKSLAHIRHELTRQYPMAEGGPDASVPVTPTDQLRTCVASQTEPSADSFCGGAKFAEMAKTKMQYYEWRKRIKLLQQKLADHVEKIEPGQLESDKDRLLLTQEREQYLKELRCIPLVNKRESEVAQIKQECRKIEMDLNNVYEYSNLCIANRLRLHEEKQMLLQQLQDALKSTKVLEERLKSFSSGSTFSISSGSSLGSLSTASSKNSLSALSFIDIYGDPLQVAAAEQSMVAMVPPSLGLLDIREMQRRANMMLSQLPSELSLSPRSSLSVETPPGSPINAHAAASARPGASSSGAGAVGPHQHPSVYDEPTYENMRPYDNDGGGGCAAQTTAMLDTAAFDCVRLEERLLDLESGQQHLQQQPPMLLNVATPLLPIIEKPRAAVGVSNSELSSASQTRSVSAAVSSESVAGDSGVFEAARSHLTNQMPTAAADAATATAATVSTAAVDVDADTGSESAQVQIGIRYLQLDAILHVTIEQARTLSALYVPIGSQLYFRLALLPNTNQTVRTAAFSDLHRPAFSDTFAMSIPLTQLHSKTLQVYVLSVQGPCEEIVGCALVSLAEFAADETGTRRWYNIISFRCIQSMGGCGPSATAGGVPFGSIGRDESLEESSFMSSQASTLTRDLGEWWMCIFRSSFFFVKCLRMVI